MRTRISLGEVVDQYQHLSDDRRTETKVAFSINVVVATVAVILRLLSRYILRARLQADDICVVAALLVTWTEFAASTYGNTIGGGRHIVLASKPVTYFKVVLGTQCSYILGTCLVKTSIVLLYRRLFGCNKPFHTLLMYTLAFIFTDHLIQILVSIFQCRPVNASWNPRIIGNCIDISLAAVIFGSINVIIDFFLLIMPMPLVWRLQIQRKWKWQIIGMFLLGGFVCVGSIYRATAVRKFGKADATWENVDPAIWALTENSIGIVSACLPTMRPLYSLLAKGHRCSISSGHCCRCTGSESPSPANYNEKAPSTGASSKFSRAFGIVTPIWSFRHVLFRLKDTKKEAEAVTSSRCSDEVLTRIKADGADVDSKRDSDRTLVSQVSSEAPPTPPKDEMLSELRFSSITYVLDLEQGGIDNARDQRNSWCGPETGPYIEIF